MPQPRHRWCLLLGLLLSCRPDAVAPDALPPPATPQAPREGPPTELLVRAADAGALADLGAARPAALPGWWRLTPRGGIDETKAALQARLGESAVQYNLRYAPDLRPTDPAFVQQYAHAITDAELGWDIRTDARSVVVAVIGTGVDRTHPELAPQMWANVQEVAGNGVDDDGNGFVDDVWGWDFLDDDADPRPLDDHETAVACVIGGRANNGVGGAGVVWQARIMNLRVAYQSDSVAAAIRYAVDNGASILNMSFGSYVTNKYGPDGVVRDALDHAEANGVLAIATAGNDNIDRLRYPAAHPYVLGVAATDQSDRRASFSNYGGWISVSAPGRSIYSCRRAGTYDNVNGTSYAAPYVAGVAALLRAEKPTWTLPELRYVLETSGEVVPADRPIGRTRINVQGALSSSGLPAQVALLRRPYEGQAFSPGAPIRVLATVRGGPWVVSVDGQFSGLMGTGEVLDGELGSLQTGHLLPGEHTVELALADGSAMDAVTFRIERQSLSGFPFDLGRAFVDASVVGDLDGDGVMDIVFVDTLGNLQVVGADGQPRAGFPVSVLPPSNGLLRVLTPALHDLDGDGRAEILLASGPGGDAQVRAYDHRGNLVPGWDKRPGGRLVSAPVVADVDADGRAEVLVVVDDDQDLLFMLFELGGNLVPGWPVRPPAGFENLFPGANQNLTVANLDLDPQLEIAVGGSYLWVLDGLGLPEAGWPLDLGGRRMVSADFDGDGVAELVTGGSGSALGLEGDGSTMPGWPQFASTEESQLTVGWLFDEDTGPSVVAVSRDGTVRVWRANGQSTPGWPKRVGELGYLGGPVLADLDGDGAADVLVMNRAGVLHAYDREGRAIAGFPADLEVQPRGVPTLLDFDGDGDLDLVQVSQVPSAVQVFDLALPGVPTAVAWGSEAGDGHNTNFFPRAFGLSATVPAEGELDIRVVAPTDLLTPAYYALYRDDVLVGTSSAGQWRQTGLDRRSQRYFAVAYDGVRRLRARSEVLNASWPDLFCLTRSDGVACEDGERCTVADACRGGVCTGANDDGASCDDGSACTQIDVCRGGVCAGEDPVTCEAAACQSAFCNPASGECVEQPVADGAACDDGDLCTGEDTCQAGTCVGRVFDCFAGDDQCGSRGICDPTTGECSTPMAEDGTACDDGDGCTTDDVCRAGTCRSDPIVCQPIRGCTVLPVCDPEAGQCVTPPECPGEGPPLSGGRLEEGGCGCRTSGGAAAGWGWGLVGLLALRLRRPRA